jgi:hypothetical protein
VRAVVTRRKRGQTCHTLESKRVQGVIIPAANVRNLMLDDEVVAAVRVGSFHIWPVETIDRGIELLTGQPPGTTDENRQLPRRNRARKSRRTAPRQRRTASTVHQPDRVDVVTAPARCSRSTAAGCQLLPRHIGQSHGGETRKTP